VSLHHKRHQVLRQRLPRLFSLERSTGQLSPVPARRLCLLHLHNQASHSGFLCAQERAVLAPGAWLRPTISLLSCHTMMCVQISPTCIPFLLLYLILDASHLSRTGLNHTGSYLKGC
jgi:hypothetical protein